MSAVRELIELFEGRVHIVSKACPRIVALLTEWLDGHGVFSAVGLPRANMHFIRERRDKDVVCRRLRITRFVDDRLDVLQHLTAVEHRYLFTGGLGSHEPPRNVPSAIRVVPTWAALVAALRASVSSVAPTSVAPTSEEFPVRRWPVSRSACFSSPDGPHGALSNFARRFPLVIDGIDIPTSEHLYQALRFPDSIDDQLEICLADTPKTAKQLAHDRSAMSGHPQWDAVRVDAMRWAIHTKARQHVRVLTEVLKATNPLAIVERSARDRFWGAAPDGRSFVGSNVLGCLWMEVRQEISRGGLEAVDVASCGDLALFGRPLDQLS